MLRFLLSILCLAVSTISFAQNDLNADIKKLNLFLKSLDERYVDSLETAPLVEKGIKTMLEELDPHSVYFNPEQYKRATEPLAGKFKGIGIRYRVIDDTLTIVEVLEDSPAEKGQLRIGDQLIAIGTDTLSGKAISSKKMSTIIKAERNTDQPFLVNRFGETLSPVLGRSNVSVASVPTYYMIDKEVAYLKLNRFSSTSVSEVKTALDELNKSGMKKLIFDLRGNSGGYLNAAIKIVDEFLEDRRLIVYTEGTHQSKRETYANSGGRFTQGDLVVLIDERSASASEIVAGAIQDWDRGLIVGRRSYGKGLVQRTIEYDDGSAMRLTISRYYTPTGRSIQKPYDDGLKAYKSDLKQRRLSGELLSSDSIKVNDSLVYFTPNKRKVYGGGGIIPDVFIAADTTQKNEFISALRKKGMHYLFALRYQHQNENDLREKYPTVYEYTENFSLQREDLQKLRSLVEHRGDTVSDEAFESSISIIQPQIEGLIARYVYGYQEHFQRLSKNDKAIQKAIAVLHDDTFGELGLNQQ
ncbi:MAG: S41 family peptidase [Salibacteraceae bacterium]